MSDESEPLGLIELDQNLGDVEKPPLLPAGKYKGEVTDVQQEVSGKGNNYYAIAVKIPPSEIPAHLQDDFEEGATLFWNRQLVPTGKDRRALYNLRKMVEAFGLSSNVTAIDPNEWMGCEVGIVVKHSRYQGEDRAELGSIFPIDAGRVSKAEDTSTAAAPNKRTAARGRR